MILLLTSVTQSTSTNQSIKRIDQSINNHITLISITSTTINTIKKEYSLVF